MTEEDRLLGTAKKDDALTKVTTPRFRASFVTVFEPKIYKGGAPKYSIVMLFDKNKISELKDLVKLVESAAIERWGEVPAEVKYNPKEDSEYSPFKNGDSDKKSGYDGYAGTIYATASSLYPPAVVDTGDSRKDISPQVILDPKELYSGCYARASVICFTWESKGFKGVSFGLQNIQKLADGEAFSGRGNPEADFDPIAPETIEVADTKDLFAEMTGTNEDSLEGL